MTTSVLHLPRPPAGRLPRLLAAAALVAAAATLAMHVGLPHGGRPQAASSTARVDGGVVTAASAGPAAEPATSTSSGAGAAPPIAHLPDLGLRIARTAELSVRVPRDVAGTLDRASELARTLGGYVVSSRAVGGVGAEPDAGSVTLRVPSVRFTTLVAELSSLGRELSRTVASQDLTQDYVDTGSRLRSDRAVQVRLLDLLGRAHTVSEVLAVQDRLAGVQQQLDEEQGRLRYLGQITSLSTVTLAVSTPRARPPHTVVHGSSWGIGHALSRSAHLLVDTVGAIVIAAGALAPALALAALAFAVARLQARRRRRASAVPGENA